MLLSSTLRYEHAMLTCDLTNPDLIDAAGRMVLEHDLIHLRRARFLWKSTCFERLLVRNFDDRTRRISIEVAFDADFADLFEVRGHHRERRGAHRPPKVEAGRVVLAYLGLDDRERTTTLTFDPVPDRLTGGRAEIVLELAPREARPLFLEVSCGADETDQPPRRGFFRALRDRKSTR